MTALHDFSLRCRCFFFLAAQVLMGQSQTWCAVEDLPPFKETHPQVAKAFEELEKGGDRRSIAQDLRKALTAVTKDSDEEKDRIAKIRQTLRGIELAIQNEDKRKEFSAGSTRELVARLQESRKPRQIWLHEPGRYHMQTNEDQPGDDPLDQIVAFGEAAIPELIERLDDKSYTRILMTSWSAGDWPYVLPTNYAALCIIEKLTGCYFDLEPGKAALGKQHAAKWWRETAGASSLERMKWQFPHISTMGMEFMFERLLEQGEDEFLKAVLKDKCTTFWQRTEAFLLVRLGEYVCVDQCKEFITDPKYVIDSTPVLYLTACGEEEHFRFLAEVVQRGLAGKMHEATYLSQIFLSASGSRKEAATLVLEAFLRSEESIEGQHSISTHKHTGTLRYRDAAMYYLKERGQVRVFELRWPREKRDAAIQNYLNRNGV